MKGKVCAAITPPPTPLANLTSQIGVVWSSRGGSPNLRRPAAGGIPIGKPTGLECLINLSTGGLHI
jgi:hypothetical protein